jgi:outer membrane protein assembly factor BamB
MLSSSLILVMAAVSMRPAGVLPPAPVELWTVAWTRSLVEHQVLDWNPLELGGATVDPVTRLVAIGTRDGVLRVLSEDGRLRWLFRASGPFEGAPLIANGVVYAGCDDGRVYALDLASGNERWRYDTQEQVGTTPVLADGLILVATLQDTLFAIDAKTGAWRWHHRREGGASGFSIHGSAGAAVSGGVVYAAYSDGYVAALDVSTGKARWEQRVAPAGPFLDIDSTPQISGSRVFVAANSGAVYALDVATLRLKLGENRLFAVTASSVVALAPGDGRQIWSAPLRGGTAGEPAIASGRLLVPSSIGLLWFDVATGRLLRTLDPGSGVSSARVAVQGKRAYVISNRGELVALDLS